MFVFNTELILSSIYFLVLYEGIIIDTRLSICFPFYLCSSYVLIFLLVPVIYHIVLDLSFPTLIMHRHNRQL